MVETGVPMSVAPLSAVSSSVDRWTHPAVILVATNLSDQDRLMPLGLNMARETGARLILLHALPASASLTVDLTGMPYYDPAGAMDFARKTLEPWCEQARKSGIVCEGLVREGHAGQEIISAARQFRADRLLLGTRSRSKLGKLLLGSVAEQVLRSVNLPVITVGPEAHLPAPGSDVKTVLLATTLGETSRPSAVLACQAAASQHARLELLHVLPPVSEMERQGMPTGLDSAALRELRKLAEETSCGCSTEIEAKVLHGNPAVEILAEASAGGASLIILGATHRSAFENLTRDRTVYRVLAHARCPVLTLRVPEEKPLHAEAASYAVHL